MVDYDVYDHRDIQASCLDLDIKNEKLLLAGKRCIAITKASDPENAEQKFIRRNKFDLSIIKWCPHVENRQQIAAASSQFYEIYNLRPTGIQLNTSGRAHSRNITDLDWDRFNWYQFATCSVDDCVNLWDVRDLKKPTLSLNIVAGAVQVKWCKLLKHIFATAHDGDIRIWDIRKGAVPVQFISAHLAKVLSFDWHPRNDVTFVSTSLDRTVKIFDFTKPSEPEIAFNTQIAVWKAKFAPFGDALFTIPFPQMSRIENNVTLWNTNDTTSPVHGFLGHSDLVLDFCSKSVVKTTTGEGEDVAAQLYTLSKDYSLRLWSIDSKFQALCGQKTQSRSREIPATALTEDFAESLERATSFSDLSSSATSFSVTLVDDFDWTKELNDLRTSNIPGIIIEEVDEGKSSVLVSVEHRRYVIKMSIKLSRRDGRSKKSSSTEFVVQFSKESNAPTSIRMKLFKYVQDSCQQRVETGQFVLKSCLTALPKALEQFSAESESFEIAAPLPSPQIIQSATPDVFASYVNTRVPFPATCGVRFNSVGILVCFGRVDLPNTNLPNPTPRSYASLVNYMREPRSYFTVKQDVGNLKSFYYPTREMRTPRKIPRVDSGSVALTAVSRESTETADESCTDLLIYDLTAIMPFSKDLAKSYCLDDDVDISETCVKNANAVAAANRKDLVKMWKVLSHCTDRSLKPSLDCDLEVPWAMMPFGRKLVNYFIDHYCRNGDVQTAAMICCVLGTRPRYFMGSRSSASRSSAASETLIGGAATYNTIHSADGIYEALTGYFQRQRSGSFSEETETASNNGCELVVPLPDAKVPISEQDFHDRNVKLLDPDMTEKYETIKQAYADILYRWNMLNERANVLKYSCRPPDRSRGVEYVTACKNCGAECRSPYCGANSCKSYAFICYVCKSSVKGLTSVCSLCTHGGHTSHLADWFRLHDKCPSGCGCSCLYV